MSQFQDRTSQASYENLALTFQEFASGKSDGLPVAEINSVLPGLDLSKEELTDLIDHAIECLPACKHDEEFANHIVGPLMSAFDPRPDVGDLASVLRTLKSLKDFAEQTEEYASVETTPRREFDQMLQDLRDFADGRSLDLDVGKINVDLPDLRLGRKDLELLTDAAIDCFEHCQSTDYDGPLGSFSKIFDGRPSVEVVAGFLQSINMQKQFAPDGSTLEQAA